MEFQNYIGAMAGQINHQLDIYN